MTSFLENFSGDLLFTTHRQADIDGLACAIALKEHFGGGRIVLRSMRKEAKRFLDNISEKAEIKKNLPDADSTIVVDCLSISQTGYTDFPGKVGLIDHHFSKEREADFTLFEERPSCAEIVAEIVNLTPKSRKALVAGIISDTGFFRLADKKTFATLASLLDSFSVEDAVSLIQIPSSTDRKLAILKAAQRAKIVLKEPLVVVSEIGSYEADAARALVKLGADLALVNSKKGKLWRTSVRSRKIGIHFGRLLKQLAMENGGEGGGHDCAATMNTPNRHNSKILEAISESFNL